MKVRIWKYKIRFRPTNLEVPKDGIVLSAGTVDRIMYVWIQVDPNASKKTRHFCCFETGEGYDPTGLTFIGTVIQNEYIHHIFEKE